MGWTRAHVLSMDASSPSYRVPDKGHTPPHGHHPGFKGGGIHASPVIPAPGQIKYRMPSRQGDVFAVNSESYDAASQDDVAQGLEPVAVPLTGLSQLQQLALQAGFLEVRSTRERC